MGAEPALAARPTTPRLRRRGKGLLVKQASIKLTSLSPRRTLAIVFVMAVLAISRRAEDYHQFALGALSFVTATIGRRARWRHWPSWARAGCILLITAFYVDNGPNLPLWRQLPQISFWFLPSLVGGPILLNAFLRHPLARRKSPS